MIPAVGCHYFLPGLRSPSQPDSITALWSVPNYTDWLVIGTCVYCVNNLPRFVTWQQNGRESNSRPLDHWYDALTTTLPSNYRYTTLHYRCFQYKFDFKNLYSTSQVIILTCPKSSVSSIFYSTVILNFELLTPVSEAFSSITSASSIW